MDFDLPPSFPASGIAWERVLPPLLPGQNGTFGLYSFTPSELLTPVTEHTGPAQVCCDHSRFTVQVDVKHFNPEELMVKTLCRSKGNTKIKKMGRGW
ncbi:unnamed protein product [Oncorhynchus mykiss]|uniref:SHSP domain-containing protein n=1 Tax=Oncorhynchus mykiss TaxID=8022 RepID=A0A060X620_ONCMY|nr:unnamed protein product [Oncorhynchus mykiss]